MSPSLHIVLMELRPYPCAANSRSAASSILLLLGRLRRVSDGHGLQPFCKTLCLNTEVAYFAFFFALLTMTITATMMPTTATAPPINRGMSRLLLSVLATSLTVPREPCDLSSFGVGLCGLIESLSFYNLLCYLFGDWNANGGQRDRD